MIRDSQARQASMGHQIPHFTLDGMDQSCAYLYSTARKDTKVTEKTISRRDSLDERTRYLEEMERKRSGEDRPSE